MIRFLKVAACCAGLTAALISPVLADQLPKGAKPVSSAELEKIYAGKTADWSSKVRAYFAPDKTVRGFNLEGEVTYTGRWSVKENAVCMKVNWKAIKGADSGTGTDCWTWFFQGKKLYTLWSTRYDGSKPKKNDYYQGENKTLKNGDLVSKKIAELTQ